ncbi:MAG TPA: molybdopterin cofactor-binding domain-containing protein [Stellaceae bacterium]
MTDEFLASRRDLLKGGGALIVSFALGSSRAAATDAPVAPLGKSLDKSDVDAFLALHPNGTATVYSGKVDLGTGLRIALRQLVAEELGIGVDAIMLVEGDTALTPDQGPTAGSTGIAQGGMEIRRAAATARRALLRLAAERLHASIADLDLVHGEVRNRRGAAIAIDELLGNRSFRLKVDPDVPLRAPAQYRVIGKKLPRPDIPAKVRGRHVFVHDLVVPGMWHGRVIRPPAIGARLVAVDEPSIAALGGVRIVRIRDFIGVVAENEWNAVRAARQLKLEWGEAATLPEQAHLFDTVRQAPVDHEESIVSIGDAVGALFKAERVHTATYRWPIQSHASLGPSCAVADVRADGATIWTASQSTHRFRHAFARFLGLPVELVRLIYLDGAGCYGMNGHEDAAADAALLSQALGRPVRVQWMREDEHGWDPKGPPQLLDLAAALDAHGRIAVWRSEQWLPAATKGLPNIPLLAPAAAGRLQTPGLFAGLIEQNADPGYAVPDVEVRVHWLKETPLRPSNIRAPGKIANTFAVEGFVDELAAAAGADPVAFRLAQLTDPRGVDVLTRAAKMLGWSPRPSPNRASAGAEIGEGRGIAYVHYKQRENYVAVGIEVAVVSRSGEIRVKRVVCAHDCGLVVNPDALANQLEGNIVQTLSRALHEEVTFDRARVTSTDWRSYPILTFPELPVIELDIVDRPELPPFGAGEAASAPVPAALANAVFDATGARLRSVPMTPARVREALAARRS